MITCSIVIYTSNIDPILNLADQILESDYIDFLFVVDNGMTNISDKFTYNSRIEYIFNGMNLGYGAGHNVAIKKAIDRNSEYHIVVNPDISLNSDVISRLYGYAKQDATIGLVMPKILYPNGDTQFLCKLLPTPFDLLFRRFFPFKRLIEKRNRTYEMRFTNYANVMEVPSLSGCFMFMKTSILKNIGGFDERYFMYLEDLDLCRRIGQHAKTIYYPRVGIIHHYGKGSYKDVKLLTYHIISAVKYFNKWGWVLDKERRNINKRTILEQMPVK